MPADFSLLQMPGFAQAALGGYQAGQAMAKQRRSDAALQGVDFGRPETIIPVLQADPALGASLLTASSAMAKAQHETAGRVALTNMLLGSGGAKPGSDVPTSAATGTMAAAGALSPGSPTDANGDIVVTGPAKAAAAPASRWSPEEMAMIKEDPQGFLAIQDNMSRMDETHRKAVADAADAQASLYPQLKAIPTPEGRRAFAIQQAPMLAAHGITAEQINAFDYSDAGLDSAHNIALGVKGVVEQQDKDRTFGLQREKFDHDVSHDAATLGVSRGNLAVSQGQLSLSRQREGRVAAKATTSKAGPLPTLPSPTTREAYGALAKGTRYRAPDGSVRIK